MRNKEDKQDTHTSDEENQKISQKIGRFFHTETQKEKVLRYEDFDGAGDLYYAGVSAVYKVAQRALWLLFILFMLLSIVFNHSQITYDNFYYLIKDFSGAADYDGSYYETLSYESDHRQNFTLYRGGLASVSPSKISVFTATGRRTLNATTSFSSPFMESSGKYILVYDTSGTTFSIYNSFARVFTKTVEYPVMNASLGEDGSFAIVTRTAAKQSVIQVYNKNFKMKKMLELETGYYAFDIVLNTENNTLSVLSYDAGNGTGRTTLSLRDLDTLEEIEAVRFDGEFPIACGTLDNQSVVLLTDRYIRIFDRTLSEKESSGDYSVGNITGYSLTSEGVAVSATLSSQTMIYAFDKDGNRLYNDTVDFNVSDVGVYGSYIFLQTENGVKRLNSNAKKEEDRIQSLASGTGKMLIYNQKTVLVCGESKAEYLIFQD
ncbi:MAG: hypothetical protein J6Q82_00625 [Clostridia bacterium]|nr:hypothetical protein [Clostridia bacterium]